MLNRRSLLRIGSGIAASGVGLALLPSPGRSVSARQSAPLQPDPAYVVLRPADLPDESWTHDGAFHDGLAAVARVEATYRGRSNEAMESALRRFGWQSTYMSSISQTGDDGELLRRIRSYVTEYQTEDGAAGAFASFEDETHITTASDVPVTTILGDEIEATRDSGVSGTTGLPYVSLDVTFRMGTLIAGVTDVRYGDGSNEPASGEVEALAGIIAGRMAASGEEAPRLGLKTLRLDLTDPDLVLTYEDAYYRVAGVDVPLSGEGGSTAARRIAGYGDAVDVYQLWQGRAVDQSDGLLYGVTHLAFVTDTGAHDWLAGIVQILGANPFYSGLRVVDEPTDLAGEATLLEYVAGGATETPKSVLVAMRTGNVVTRFHLTPQGRDADVTPATALSIAERSIACDVFPCFLAMP